MKPIVKQLEREQLTDTKINLIMPEKVLNQIKYLCSKIAKVEWSGILFYSIEGSITDPKNMVITLEDILPMHKGTSAYTEYSFDERVIEYMMENEESENWKMGHIHSHNTMGVFFSGTDWSELEDNAPNHNFYVSLIVNNFMEFCAKTCFIVETKDTKAFDFTAKDENGKKYVYKSEDYVVEEKKLVVYDNEIITPNETIIMDESFTSKVTGIITAAERRAVTTFKGHAPITYGRTWQERQNQHNKKHHPWQNPLGNKTTEKDRKDFTGWDAAAEKVEQKDTFSLAEEIQKSDDREKDVEEFAKFVINTGNDTTQYGNIEDILAYYRAFGLGGNALAKSILEKYVNMYDKFFDKVVSKDMPQIFVEVTEEVIEEYELIVGYAPDKIYTASMLEPVILGLTAMIEKFKETEKIR